MSFYNIIISSVITLILGLLSYVSININTNSTNIAVIQNDVSYIKGSMDIWFKESKIIDKRLNDLEKEVIKLKYGEINGK